MFPITINFLELLRERLFFPSNKITRLVHPLEQLAIEDLMVESD
jgi:hypothetical protein